MPRIHLRYAELPRSLTGWLAVNDLGVPRLWATVWADILLCGVAESTRGSHLAAVEKLYQSAAEQAGGDCLDLFIATLDTASWHQRPIGRPHPSVRCRR